MPAEERFLSWPRKTVSSVTLVNKSVFILFYKEAVKKGLLVAVSKSNEEK